MSIFQPAPQPFAPATAPFAASGCRCHQAVAEGRATLAATVTATTRDCDDAMTAIARSRSIAWQGPAADLYRQRLDALIAPLTALDTDAAATLRLAETAGA